jgi:hypothetical protein
MQPAPTLQVAAAGGSFALITRKTQLVPSLGLGALYSASALPVPSTAVAASAAHVLADGFVQQPHAKATRPACALSSGQTGLETEQGIAFSGRNVLSARPGVLASVSRKTWVSKSKDGGRGMLAVNHGARCGRVVADRLPQQHA